jgi:ribose 5-phosphate isomerase B
MTSCKDERAIVVGSDHGGLQLKNHLAMLLRQWGYTVTDAGTHTADSVDYPIFAAAVARSVAEGTAPLGLLVCGSGIGMSIAANRFPQVRAALCTSAYMARMARAHNHANVLCLGERVIGPGEAEDILRAFLDGPCEGGRHQRRVDQLGELPDRRPA